jgi:two-component system OmpR family sensor kinase/two-component system sensor histidine kinase BaeS
VNRLWVRLTLAFALVILVTVSAVALLANLTAGRVFRSYLAYSDTPLHQTLSERLAEYYQARGTWAGVETILDRVGMMPAPPPGARRSPAQSREGPFHVILADADGHVVYDRLRNRPGRSLTRDEASAAQEIVVDGETVGQLVIVLPIESTLLGPLEERFLSRLRFMLVGGALVAGALGVLLGLGLSRSLTAPLQRLATTARAVAARDFSRRVQVDGSAELHAVAQAFNDMVAALEESEQQRRNLVADVAHELRTPLSVVQGNLQAILDDVYPLDKAEISRLYDETRLLARLVDDLRELALADAGQLLLNVQPTEIAPIVYTTADHLSLAADAHEVTLSAEVPQSLPTVQADTDRLAQVLRNLLVNAVQHTPPGGSVTVTAQSQKDVVEISVCDTGTGIPPEDLSSIFDRFWRADRSRTRDERWPRGTGLGLSIAQSLIQAQGGRIWAESQPGRGSIFRFTLPRAARDG